MDELRKQVANKRPVLEKYLATTRLQAANIRVEDVSQDVISTGIPLNVDDMENETDYSSSNSSDSEEGFFKNDESEKPEFPHFDEIKAFLVNGRPFQNLRANFQHFIRPNPSNYSSIEEKPDPNTTDQVFSLPIVEELQFSIAILIFGILWIILLCNATFVRLRFKIWKLEQFLICQYTKLSDTIFGGSLLPPGIVRIEWICNCGHVSYDDLVQLQPGSVEALAQELRDNGVERHATTTDRTKVTLRGLGTLARTPGSA
jgi:hypothetical protein